MFPSHDLIVGVNANQALVVADLVKDVLVPGGQGVRVSVAGRTNDPLWWSSPIPGQIDSSVVPAVAYQVAEVGWKSQPA